MNRNTDRCERIRVLLVDDETDFTSILSKRLTRYGMEVATASEGSEAYGLLESEPFDVVVLDMNIPGLGGVHILRTIKEQFKDVEVIILSGHASISDALKTRSAGAFDFLFKPTETSELSEVIVAATRSGFPSTDGNRPTSVAI